MIHYHGGPITPLEAGYAAWKCAHAFVSYAYPDQARFAAEDAYSFAVDNGAFTAWLKQEEMDFSGYAEWVEVWRRHPGFDWCLIPDVIDGDWEDNARLIDDWKHSTFISVPVWHLHEPPEWLEPLIGKFPRIAFGSSRQWSEVGSKRWWNRMSESMEVACDGRGRPRVKLHGLRMLDPTVFSHIPLSSADSTNIARSVSMENVEWGRDPYPPMTKAQRAVAMRNNINHHASAPRWIGTGGIQQNLELCG